MEVIHCLNFIFIFISLVLIGVNTAFLIRISLLIVNIADILKKVKREVESLEEEEEYEELEPKAGLVDVGTSQLTYDEEIQ